jgi:Fic family protein
MSVTTAELADLVAASNAIERIDAIAGEPAYDDHLAAAALALDGECDPRTLHAVLTRRLSPAHEVGALRRIAISIGGERPPEPGPHIAIHFGRLMEQLVAGPRDNEDPEAAAARLHHEFQAVHPFSDANGRTGRLLWNALRARSGLPLLVIRPGEEQRAYFAAIREYRRDRFRCDAANGFAACR